MIFEAGSAIVGLILIFLVYKYMGQDKSPSPAVSKTAPAAGKSKDEADAGLLPMKIFFGSQSGTAETFAGELADEGKKYGFKAEVVDLEDYDPDDDMADEKFAVFLMSTFGEGEPTDNAVSFMEWVENEDEREDNYFKDIPFAVFALGNRQYEHFCNIGRNLDKILHKFGGTRVVDHGEGDDDNNLDEDFAEWKKEFWMGARKQFNLKGSVDSNEPNFTPSWTFKTHEGEYDTEKALVKDPKQSAFFVPVVANYELRQDCSDAGSTVHVEIDISEHKRLRYVTADNLGVYARNDFKQAGQMIKRLGGNPKDLFSLRKSGDLSKFMFPSPCSVQDAFLWYVDFNNMPRLKILRILSDYATDNKEKEQLLRYCDEEKEAFAADQKSLFEVLDQFPSVKVPLEHFLEFCPKMSPRFYTISSSSKVNPDVISLTSSLLFGPKANDRSFKGVCTHYLQSLRPGKDRMCVVVRTSTFRLPRKLATSPVIMVGPGTGIAPFRGFVQEFSLIKQKEGTDMNTTLFFGCKKSTTDYIYKDELEAAQEIGALTNLHLAFSREQEKKVYVQDLVQEHGDDVWHLISEKKAYFYVCGATTMGRAVKDVVINLAVTKGGKTKEEANKFVETMTNTGRYVQELWS